MVYASRIDQPEAGRLGELIENAKPKLDFDLTVNASVPRHRHIDQFLSTPSPGLSFCSFCQHAVDYEVVGLDGPARCVPAANTKLTSGLELTSRTAKPTMALLPYRAGSAAFLSSTSSSQATPMQKPALVAGNPGTPPPMKQARREVPLPSQEGKKGAMQYALYVETCCIICGPGIEDDQGRQSEI